MLNFIARMNEWVNEIMCMPFCVCCTHSQLIFQQMCSFMGNIWFRNSILMCYACTERVCKWDKLGLFDLFNWQCRSVSVFVSTFNILIAVIVARCSACMSVYFSRQLSSHFWMFLLNWNASILTDERWQFVCVLFPDVLNSEIISVLMWKNVLINVLISVEYHFIEGLGITMTARETERMKVSCDHQLLTELTRFLLHRFSSLFH